MTGGANGSETFVIQTVDLAFKFNKIGPRLGDGRRPAAHHPGRHLGPAAHRARRERCDLVVTVARPARRARVLKYLSLRRRHAWSCCCRWSRSCWPSLKTHDEMADSGAARRRRGNWLNLDNYATAFTDGKMLHGVRQHRDHPRRSRWSARSSSARWPPTRSTASRSGCSGSVIGLFLLATLVPAVTTQVATFQVVNDLGPVQHPVVGDRAVPGHRHRLDLHLPAVPARHPARPGRGRRDRRRQPASPSTGGSSCRCSSRPSPPSSSSRASPSTTSSTSRSSTCRRGTSGVISTSLFRFKGPFGAQWEVISAGVILVILPTLIVFLALQRFIYNGFTAGATK